MDYVYLTLEVIGLIACFCMMIYNIVLYYKNKVNIVVDKAVIVDARQLTREEMKSGNNGGNNTLFTIAYTYKEETYHYSFRTSRLKLPEPNETINVYFDIEQKTLSLSGGLSNIYMMAIFTALFALTLYTQLKG